MCGVVIKALTSHEICANPDKSATPLIRSLVTVLTGFHCTTITQDYEKQMY